MSHVLSLRGSVLFVDSFKKPVGPCIKPKRRLSEGHRGSLYFESKRRLSEGPCMKPKRRLRYGWLEFESGFTGKPYSLF